MKTWQSIRFDGSLHAILASNGSRCWTRGKAKTRSERRKTFVTVVLGLALCVGALPAMAQSSNSVIIRGRVLDLAGKPVADASIRLEGPGGMKALSTISDADGNFAFLDLNFGAFSLSAEKENLRSGVSIVAAHESDRVRRVDLILEKPIAAPSKPLVPSSQGSGAMEFADSPNFKIAGVTDWTAAGGHGSDASLRASEALNREAITLNNSDGIPSHGPSTKSTEQEEMLRAALTSAPASFDANHKLGELYLGDGKFIDSVSYLLKAFQIDPRNAENEFELAEACEKVGDLSQARLHVQHLLETKPNGAAHRLAGELDEKSGDPLSAVHEFERAVRVDPSEQNYFNWGSELLIHRAVWQAKEVFERGIHAYPHSARLLTALGAALFGGALYEEAALRLCEASDLNPNDPEAYLLMGKVEIAAPTPLACFEKRLERFVQMQPDNAQAHYYLAMTLWKENGQAVDEVMAHKIESMLTKATMIDPKFSDPYVQLGILYYARGQFAKSADAYTKAIELDPQSSEAHYRLGVAYDRLGERSQAKQEFQLHEEIERQHAVEVDRERRAVKQFVVEVLDKPNEPEQ
jgi:tetratricopeptide (TPR) repeat protein